MKSSVRVNIPQKSTIYKGEIRHGFLNLCSCHSEVNFHGPVLLVENQSAYVAFHKAAFWIFLWVQQNTHMVVNIRSNEIYVYRGGGVECLPEVQNRLLPSAACPFVRVLNFMIW